tara:strand:- start:32 stop:382 length:351 start_codon:yes stop_codon:yes gene_type:complete
MARLKAKSIDRNRLAKKYPFVRAPKKLSFFGDNDVIIELLTVTFTNESQKTVSFSEPMPDTTYRVAFSPRDTGSDSANVNLYVDDTQSGLSQVGILASAPFSGVVDVIIIRVGSVS